MRVHSARASLVTSSRLTSIDALRGLALLCMLVFHFAWDLNFFNIVSFSLYTGVWGLFQLAILSTFVVVAGFSLVLAQERANSQAAYVRRIVKLGVAAAVISLVTWILFPTQCIYFGVIHLILFSSIGGILFTKRKVLAGVCGVLLIALPFLMPLQSVSAGIFFWLGLGTPLPALDFVPVIPWFGVFLLGVCAAQINEVRAFFEHISLPRQSAFLQALGKRSLLVYLLHQCVLFPLAWAISLLT